LAGSILREPRKRNLKLSKFTLATAAGIVIALSGSLFSAPAIAAEMPPQTPAAPPATAVDSENSLSSEQKDAIYVLISATDREAGTFDSDEALAAGVDEQAVAEYAAAFQNTAGLSSEVQGEASGVAPSSAAMATACTGKHGYTGFYGWVGRPL
jgi:hypothetical protein